MPLLSSQYRFLQSSGSSLRVDELSSAYQQGLTVASCLLSGLQVFQPTYPDQERCISVLRGFHGLHLYSSEYWIEYVLSIAASEGGFDTSSRFFLRSMDLATTLNSLRRSANEALRISGLDGRLGLLEGHPALLEAARGILSDQTSKTAPLAETETPEASLCEITNVPTLLANYQYTIRSLLRHWKFSGVSIQELEKFKQDFRSTAFTCRFYPCPFASTGFANGALQDEHEQAHTPRIHCDSPSCHYPPFGSPAALRKHKSKHHEQDMSKFKIRSSRVGQQGLGAARPRRSGAIPTSQASEQSQDASLRDKEASLGLKRKASSPLVGKTREAKRSSAKSPSVTSEDTETKNQGLATSSTMTPLSRSPAPDLEEEDVQHLPEINQEVLALRDDGVVFTDPPCMRGVPLAKIGPDHPYWEEDWQPIQNFVEQSLQKWRDKYDIYKAMGSSQPIKFLASRQINRGIAILKFLKEGEIHPYQIIGKGYIRKELCNYDALFRMVKLLEELEKLNVDVTPTQWLRQRLHELCLEMGDNFSLARTCSGLYHDPKVMNLRRRSGFR
jgi:hypothetical protein